MINWDNKKLQAYVTSAHSDYIYMRIFDETLKKLAEERGYLDVGKDTWGKDFNEEEKVAEMAYLRDIGMPFSIGPGWPPADVFEYLVEQGKLNGPYKRISWSGPGKYTIVERHPDSRIPLVMEAS